MGWIPFPSANDTDAIHDNVAGEIAAITAKAAPVNADLVIIEDSEDSNNKKKAQLGDLPGGGSSGYPTFSGCRAYRATSDYSIPSASTFTAIPLTGESYDTDTMHDNSTNNTRITVPAAGKYAIFGGIGFQSESEKRTIAGYWINGADSLGSQQSFGGGDDFDAFPYHYGYDIRELAANDYIELVGWTTAATTRNARFNLTFLAVHRLD